MNTRTKSVKEVDILAILPKSRACRMTDAIAMKFLGKCHRCKNNYSDYGVNLDGIIVCDNSDVASITCLRCKSSAAIIVSKDSKE